MRKEAVKDLAVIPLYGATHMVKSREEGNISLVIETSCMKRGTDRGQERFACWIQKADKKHQQRNEIRSRRIEGRDLYTSHYKMSIKIRYPGQVSLGSFNSSFMEWFMELTDPNDCPDCGTEGWSCGFTKWSYQGNHS